jgi:hypothetical protein
MSTGSFPGVKRPGRVADHPPPPSAEVENEWSYTSIPPLGPWWPVIGWPFLLKEIEQHQTDDSTTLGFDRELVRHKAPSILHTNKKTC